MARESSEINPTVLSWKNTIVAPAADAVPLELMRLRTSALCSTDARLHLPQPGPGLQS